MEIKDYISPLVDKNVLSSNGIKNKLAESKSSLGVDDFLKLLSAQLSNQDMMNPSSDTEFIAQLAQFSSLQSMDSMAKVNTLKQSTDLIGKTVIVATYDKKNNLVKNEGVVDRVTLFGSEPKLFIGDKEYSFANVMEIKHIPDVVEDVEVEGENENSEEENVDVQEDNNTENSNVNE